MMADVLAYERRFGLMLLIVFMLLIWAHSPAFGLEVTVQQKAVVRGDTVRLGDIAGFDPVNDSRVSKLKGIEISASPAPGSDSTISKDLIIYRLNPYISADKEIFVRIPEALTVQRSTQLISEDRLEEIYMEYVRENSGWSEEQIRFEDVHTPGTIALPEGKLQWYVQDRKNRDFIGNVSLTIDFSVEGRLVRKVPVSGKISVRKETIKAAGRIERGRIISASDIVSVNENSVHYRKDSVVDKEDIIGKRAVRTIQADQTILAGMVENTPPVKKGDRVIINAENSELRVTASGEALQDGQTGDQVEVLNIQSGRKIFATVKGSGVVEVLF